MLLKIRSIECLGLFGKSPKGGWTNEIQPGDSVHALVIVKTDAGLIGVGSVFTDSRLAEAALGVLRPLVIGETAIEPMRVTEKLHQNSFWMGHGGTLTHTISGIDIALWDIFGQVTGQPIGRLLGGNYRTRVKAYASILMEMPELMEERTAFYRAQGFRAIKIGWGPFGRVSRKLDEQIVRAARKGAGDDCLLMVDAGGSDAFWPHGLNWAINTAHMLKDFEVAWFEEALKPDALDDFKALRERSPVPIATGECITRRQSFRPGSKGARWTSCNRMSPRSEAFLSRSRSPAPPTPSGSNISGTAGTPQSASPPICNSPRQCRPPISSNILEGRPMWMTSRRAAGRWTATGCWRFRTGRGSASH